MAEEFYQLPESPVYNAETIRKIQDTDPVRASTIVNPVISRLIENTHAVKKLADKAQQEAASAAAAEEYSSESVYNAGSYCTRGGKLYKANQDILSAEPWTEAHWTETNIAAELVAIYTALSNKAPGGYGFGDKLQAPIKMALPILARDFLRFWSCLAAKETELLKYTTELMLVTMDASLLVITATVRKRGPPGSGSIPPCKSALSTAPLNVITASQSICSL